LWPDDPKSSPNESNSDSVNRIQNQSTSNEKLVITIIIKGGKIVMQKNIKKIEIENKKAVDPQVLPPLNSSQVL